MILGNKNDFAIEIVKDKKYQIPEYGHVRVWINGYGIGNIDDIEFLDCFYGHLVHIFVYSLKVDDSDFDNYKTMDSIEDWYRFGETCDDFEIISCMSERHIKFLWRLFEEPNFTYEIMDHKVRCHKVRKSVVVETIKKFKEYIWGKDFVFDIDKLLK